MTYSIEGNYDQRLQILDREGLHTVKYDLLSTGNRHFPTSLDGASARVMAEADTGRHDSMQNVDCFVPTFGGLYLLPEFSHV